MVRSSNWSGHSPFKAVMLGSSPARITIPMGYSQGGKAPVFDTGIAGSNPAIPAMIRYSSGSRGKSAKLLIAGSNPARISIWSLRLVGQDASLSSWKYGFEPRRDHQSVRHIEIGQSKYVFHVSPARWASKHILICSAVFFSVARSGRLSSVK